MSQNSCLLAPGALGLLCSFWGVPSITPTAALCPSLNCLEKVLHPLGTPTIPPIQMASSTPSPEIFLQSTPYPQGQGLLLSGPLAITAFSLLRPTLPLELGLSTPTYSRGWWAGFSGYFGFLPLPSPTSTTWGAGFRYQSSSLAPPFPSC